MFTFAFVLLAGLATTAAPARTDYQYKETRELVALVDDAAQRIAKKGEGAFADFRVYGSRWRRDSRYIFVLSPEGRMLVHPDRALEGTDQLALRDVDGRPIIQGLLDAARPKGWHHYQWPEGNGLLPRWKSSYVRSVQAPSGGRYVVGAGAYDDRMDKAFLVSMVDGAVADLEREGTAAYTRLRDPRGPYMVKDAYVFVIDPEGVEWVNPAFPNLEGRSVLDVKDTHGKLLVREMLNVAQRTGSGWVAYMWPKPGDSVSTQKLTYVRKAKLGDAWVVVGCGAYLADAPRAKVAEQTMTAGELMALVREGAALLERDGEKAYPEFRRNGSKWMHGDTYLFVWSLKGVRVFHGANPEWEGTDVSDLKDARGRPIGKLFLDAANSASGEGWVHYQYPEPRGIFPIWKSTFVKRVRFPSGEQHLVGCGVYNMKMDDAFAQDVVNRAAELVAQRGPEAFPILRNKTGPFVFLDTYVFVETPEGKELVNAAQPSLEGQNLWDAQDLNGKYLVREYVQAALDQGSAWVDYYWYRPGTNTPALKHSFVRKVQHGDQTYIVGAGVYADERASAAKKPSM